MDECLECGEVFNADLEASCSCSCEYDFDDDRESRRGTSECDGTCVPQCDWCLVSHSCPTDCTDQGLECPYEGMREERSS
jgi:hypothetical protein